MSMNAYENSHKLYEGGNIGSVREASDLLRGLASPFPPGDRIKASIWRAVKKVTLELTSYGCDGMDYNRGRSIWYRQARRIEAFEIDAIRRAAIAREAIERAIRTQHAIGEINAEYARAAELLSEMRASIIGASLLDPMPERYRPQIDRLSQQIERLRRQIDGEASK